jgi:hypothetical protein
MLGAGRLAWHAGRQAGSRAAAEKSDQIVIEQLVAGPPGPGVVSGD